jgi:peptidoglycan L-alanyl-D-glutamate endopeptidase CwlK
LFNEVVKTYDCTIVCGHRNEADQNKAYNEGLSEKKWPESKHNTTPSLAVDVMPYLPQVGIDWKDEKALYLFIGKVMVIAHQLWLNGDMAYKVRFGADWDGDGRTRDQTFHDAGHCELIII